MKRFLIRHAYLVSNILLIIIALKRLAGQKEVEVLLVSLAFGIKGLWFIYKTRKKNVDMPQSEEEELSANTAEVTSPAEIEENFDASSLQESQMTRLQNTPTKPTEVGVVMPKRAFPSTNPLHQRPKPVSYRRFLRSGRGRSAWVAAEISQRKHFRI